MVLKKNVSRFQADSWYLNMGCYVQQTILSSGFRKDNIVLLRSEFPFTWKDNQHWILLILADHGSLDKNCTDCQFGDGGPQYWGSVLNYFPSSLS